MTRTDKILEEALKLSEAERAALAGTLLESLESEVDEDAESLWAVEIARRVTQLDSGEVHCVPWAQARKQILGG